MYAKKRAIRADERSPVGITLFYSILFFVMSLFELSPYKNTIP